jgi:phage shock protein A
MLDQSKDREEKQKQFITTLKTEIAQLKHQVDQCSQMSIGQDNTVNELVENKKKLENDLADFKNSMEKEKTDNLNLRNKIKEKENKLASLEIEHKNLKLLTEG